MEDIKDKLGEYRYHFFHNLQNYLETELIFFGSIKRYDFFKNASDIDITIITDNVKSLLFKLQVYLNIDKPSIKKIYQQYSVKDNGFITGYKIKYTDKSNDNEFDLLIYDEKYREIVMKNVNDINNLPIYMVILLNIIKYLHYTLCVIPKIVYNNIKCFIFHCYFNKEIKSYDRLHTSTIILENA